MLHHEVGRHLVVMGLMASGKSTVGGEVARRLGRRLLDNDQLLTDATGRTAAEVEAAEGTEGLHRREAQLLVEALGAPAPLVVTAAASAVADPDVRTTLAHHDVVWLRADPDLLARRVSEGGNGHRPRRGPDLHAMLASQARRRDPLFASVATIVVDVEPGLSPEAIAEEIVQRVRADGAGR